MQSSKLRNTALAGILASLILAATAFAGPENKPAKVAWSPSRVVNADVDEGTGAFVVEVSSDKEIQNAQLWVSGSLASVLDWDPAPFDIPAGGSVEIESRKGQGSTFTVSLPVGQLTSGVNDERTSQLEANSLG